MNRVLIFNFSEEMCGKFSGERLVPRITSPDILIGAYRASLAANNVECIWLDTPYSSLSDILWDAEWESVPIILCAYNVGDVYRVVREIDAIRRLNIRIYLSTDSDTCFTDLKILSSLGIDCGLRFGSTQVDDEKFMDLASYFYLSPVPHASIEPFEYIARNLNNEQNINFSSVYFRDHLKYLYVDENLNLAYSFEELKSNKFLGNLESLKGIDFNEEIHCKITDYYQHFMQLDTCSKCASFKICNKDMERHFSNCQEVFSVIYEYAEIRQANNNSPNAKTICQL